MSNLVNELANENLATAVPVRGSKLMIGLKTVLILKSPIF